MNRARMRQILVGGVVCLLCTVARAQTVLYVDVDATDPPHDGSSWCHAYLTLHEALSAPPAAGTTIRVANGTYTPDPTGLTDPREATFELINGVTIEGGYAGCGAANPDERDVVAHETTLSGDLAGDDGPDFENNDENSYHVVTGGGTDETAVLDGFTIRGGNADGASPHNRGGGVYNDGGSPTLASCTLTSHMAGGGGAIHNRNGSNPTLTDCTIADNTATLEGGGLYNIYGSSPVLGNCTFQNNTAERGGGVYCYESHPTLTDCVFRENSATSSYGRGGGFYCRNDSNPTLLRCTFLANTASGQFARGGAMHVRGGEPLLTGCAFIANVTATKGGAIYTRKDGDTVLTDCLLCWNSAGTYGGAFFSEESAPALTHCTLAENLATDGKAVACDTSGQPSTVQIRNCILWNGGSEVWNNDGSTITITYSDVQGGWPGEGNIGDLPEHDPLFVDPDGPDDIPGTEDDDLHLSFGSPCIEGGDPGFEPEPGATDMDGEPRIMGCRVDMGADEFTTGEQGSGDFNGDGEVDLEDIPPFVQIMLEPTPLGDCVGDLNGDGESDGDDIQFFIDDI